MLELLTRVINNGYYPIDNLITGWMQNIPPLSPSTVSIETQFRLGIGTTTVVLCDLSQNIGTDKLTLIVQLVTLATNGCALYHLTLIHTSNRIY